MNFSIIGCGRMGRRRAKAIVANPNAELVCVADTHREFAKKLAEETGCDLEYPFHASHRGDVDVVVVSTPNKHHFTHAMEAMNVGKHVFCEKPLAKTVMEAQLMVDKSRETGTILKVSSNIRYFGNVLKAKEMMDKGIIGDILYLRGWIGHGGWNLKPDSWFTKKDMMGGGTLIDNGCHLVDIVRWYFGDVVDCLGHTSTLHHELEELEDNAMAVLTTKSGRPMFIHSSWTEWNGYFYLELYGSKGLIQIDSRGNEAKTTITLLGTDHDMIFDFSREPKISFQREVDDFIKYLEKGETLPPTGEDGLRVLEIIEGIYKSAETGKKVTLENG